MRNKLPLHEVSIKNIFWSSDKTIYQIPIYQRNYAWEKDEIAALIQDIYDAFKKDCNKVYYIGTLVTHNRGDLIYEVIDGQQRLTTIRIILSVLDQTPTNKLTYRARKKSDITLKYMPQFDDIEERDQGIVNGYKYTQNALDEIIIKESDKTGFINYFLDNVHIIHYHVPKDVDLNHYFEVMNSRGEQLEKHEIVKAMLMDKLYDKTHDKTDLLVFSRIWEVCSDLSIYVQQKTSNLASLIFGDELCGFECNDFDALKNIFHPCQKPTVGDNTLSSEMAKPTQDIGTVPIQKAIETPPAYDDYEDDEDTSDSFQPVIDFPNFLLIVLKIMRMKEPSFNPVVFNLDDKELINEFDDAMSVSQAIDSREFVFNLLKARYLLDNYIVHHAKEEDSLSNNPWKLQRWQKGEHNRNYPKNLTDNNDIQERLVHLLSMFEVSFTARQRKNYLFYCLFYLMSQETIDTLEYAKFVENLAKRYFLNVYLVKDKLNAINTPLPGSFDETILLNNHFNQEALYPKSTNVFNSIYGDGTKVSNGVPLFVFNYLDYCIWKMYAETLRGGYKKKESSERQFFFKDVLGCSDFGLDIFDQFYFSRTRRSLEHYYPQAMATGKDGNLTAEKINCFGNFAMIGSEANSSGSNWYPKTKLDHYLDRSGKISRISVSSLKFMIMMQICKDADQWEWSEINNHEEKMLSILALTKPYQ